MAVSHLPDPMWADGPHQCLGCGYALDGLAAPGICPECGAPFDVQALVLHGIPNSSKGTPLWRRLAWIALIVGGFLLTQTMVYIGMFLSWWLVLAFAAAIVGVAIWLLATGPRDRASTERFILTSAGIARVPVKARPGEWLDSILIRLDDCDTVRLDRISPFWRRVRLGVRGATTSADTRFDAGIRCPDASAETVRATLLAMIPRAAARAHPPTTPQAFPGSPQPPPLP